MVHHDRLDSSARDIGMTVRVVADYETLSREAADIVDLTVRTNPGAAITLPTGETPRGMYGELVKRITSGDLDFSSVHLFCLDDYLGAAIDDPASLTAWLNEVFLAPANLIEGGHVHFVPTTAPDPDAAAAAYDAEIQSHGGLKLAVLGLGPNGHIGFNEPGSLPDSRTRVVDLTHESRSQNAQYYEGTAEDPGPGDDDRAGNPARSRPDRAARVRCVEGGDPEAGAGRSNDPGGARLVPAGGGSRVAVTRRPRGGLGVVVAALPAIAGFASESFCRCPRLPEQSTYVTGTGDIHVRGGIQVTSAR